VYSASNIHCGNTNRHCCNTNIHCGNTNIYVSLCHRVSTKIFPFNIGTGKVEGLNSLIMKITVKENDVNDIFADVSVTPATKCTDDSSRGYRNVFKNVVYIVFFGRYFHCNSNQKPKLQSFILLWILPTCKKLYLLADQMNHRFT